MQLSMFGDLTAQHPLMQRYLQKLDELMTCIHDMRQVFDEAFAAGCMGELWSKFDVGPGANYFHYFVRHNKSGEIKFGKTRDPEWRLVMLDRATPRGIRFLGGYIAGPEHENWIKKEVLDAERVHGEWFEPTGMVLVYLKRIGIGLDRLTDDPPVFCRKPYGGRHFVLTPR